MAKNTTQETETVKKQEYHFPELGVTVEADSLETANKMAQNHPDVIYP